MRLLWLQDFSCCVRLLKQPKLLGEGIITRADRMVHAVLQAAPAALGAATVLVGLQVAPVDPPAVHVGLGVPAVLRAVPVALGEVTVHVVLPGITSIQQLQLHLPRLRWFDQLKPKLLWR